ncbi:MAG TPA: aminodeoxychorismate lyase [Xanthomonadales bacterium]|nr:aminodeoxychorismate lyase [Xanthomonadales bacterium]
MLDCLVNGEISTHVSVTDRGLQYGDGLFETIAVMRGVPRFWQLHMDRLAIGCATLGIETFPQSLLLREVQTVSAGHLECVVKIILTRGPSSRGYTPPTPAHPSRIVSAHAMPANLERDSMHGVCARICNLRLAIQPVLGGIKHLNRLEQILASAEWNDPSVQEGVLLDPEDHVISAIGGNMFLLSGERLLTPRMDRCGVRGVMRAAILQAFKPRCEQRRISLDMLPEADEVFICNAVRGIVPVTRIGHWDYGIGPRTREIQTWLEQQ